MMETAIPRAGIYARVSKDKKATGRSVDEQETDSRTRCVRHGWTIAEIYREDPISASRFERKDRPEWERLLADLAVGRFDVLVLWESSRGDRTPESWLSMLATARDKGVAIHVVSHERTYDMKIPRDWKALADDGLDSAYESEKTSLRIRRTKAAAAQAGRPDGRYPFGYERRYDPITRALIEQHPHPEQAPVVRIVFDRIVAGDPISVIAAGLGMTRNLVRRIATNPAYIAKRRYGGQLLDGQWPPIIDEATWWAAQRVLSDPARKTTRPGRVKHLCSYLATCGVCGKHLFVRNVAKRRPIYVCQASHVGIRLDWLDRLITDLVTRRLAAPDIYPALAAVDDAAVLAARGEADSLRGRLDEFADAAARGELSAASLARVEARILPQIADADKRATLAATPPPLRALLEPGADVAERWARLAVAARKDVLRALLAEVIVKPTPLGRAASYEAIDERRVEIKWRS